MAFDIEKQDPNEILEKAMAKGKEMHPDAPVQHHAAFANSVQYLVTGWSGGYGGPSIREHAVSWALAGESGTNTSVQTNIGEVTLQYPDGSLPRAGEWDFEAACKFAEIYCFGPITELHVKCSQSEHCFDDAEEDANAIRSFRSASQN